MGGGKFSGNRPNAHSIASTSISEPITIAPTPNSLYNGRLSREDIEAFCRFISNLEVTPAAPSSSFAASGTSTSALSAYVPTSQSSWIIDSGASHHMTSMSSLFFTYKISSGRDKVHIADGSYSSIAGHSDISATSSLLLSSALHVPNFTLNLFSISQITKSLNCSVIFFPSHCVFQELETKKTISIGHEKDGLYLLDLDPRSLIATSTIRRNISITSKDELLQWHRRPGHPSFHLLQKMFPQLHFDPNKLYYEPCQLAKHCRSTNPSSFNKSSFAFSLVHSNVWGPSHVTSYFGFKYFVTFVDDNSRVT